MRSFTRPQWQLALWLDGVDGKIALRLAGRPATAIRGRATGVQNIFAILVKIDQFGNAPLLFDLRAGVRVMLFALLFHYFFSLSALI